ncbi:Transposase IS4 family protein [Carbonactinospora thermoautotrophica]|uniref:Transposase IS4 family protein n=1 Tax=Carbonactinospora thermoautotrophica TaxID=1469144 RepID=A0A132MLN8_9ACTN|nr:Transposase IS4 family protein [Carbonactinospora thermoautotrophica]
MPTRDRTVAERSKNYRYSTNLRVAIDANTRLVVAVGDPQQGNRNDSPGLSGVRHRPGPGEAGGDGRRRLPGQPGRDHLLPQAPRDGTPLPGWQEDLNAVHRSVRARIEHTLARMKCWKIPRDYRRRAHTLRDTAAGIAFLYDLALAG